ncbi:chaperone required for assembly of F1-ATPase [Peteryoungia aggregata LMG 23059]|uniref:Chaperone required for assembly of F1-ATPase n=1 Tax=Peteryoungia aggregata LMG 23059 TaxID=1368425 RepID=A0ABU0G6U2_9HYPH|nr:ATP12 family protein [Peteryoungia aggregata]MDQ0421067.1 chaperone required for assembly of F1-ATPase [Peteryoungia aggregata LMG 23059]
MRDELSQDIFGTFIPEPSHEDPVRRAQIQMKRPLPKRFYENVGMEEREDGFSITLDGKPVKTPAKKLLTLPTREAAELVVAEWAGQGEFIDPATMPITKLANTAIDAVSNSLADVFDEIVRFAGTDLLCYRADGPKELTDRQATRWDPVLAWAATAHAARFILVEGVMHQEQPGEAVSAFARALERYRDPFRISCLNVVTTLTGSAVLALAFAEGAFELDEIWSFAHLDEDWTLEHWGTDTEAEARREARYAECASAASLFAALHSAN